MRAARPPARLPIPDACTSVASREARMSTTPVSPMRHDEAVLTVAASPVRAYRAGAGPALVLLHGGGLDAGLARPQRPRPAPRAGPAWLRPQPARPHRAHPGGLPGLAAGVPGR